MWLMLCACVFSKPSTTIISAPDSMSSKGKVKFDETFGHVGTSFRRLSKGITSIIPNALELHKLRKRLKSDGASMSYSDFKRMERLADDISKLFRLGITIPLSPELFFYSYIVSPLLSPSNPFAWNALPSGFDLERDRLRRQEICTHRRFFALVQALQNARKDIIDDFNVESRMTKAKHLRRALEALNAPSHELALEKLSPWIYTQPSKAKVAKSLQILGLGGAIIKSVCRSIGVEGVPNIPLVRRLNIADLNGYCNKVGVFYFLMIFLLLLVGRG